MVALQLIGGFLLLLLGGNYLVEGGVAIARKFRVSPLVIGMTIVAMGTSAPELIVSVQAAFNGSPGIAMGNVIGSNIANIGLILGLTALIYPIHVNRNSVKTDGPVMLLASLLLIAAASTGIGLNRLEGLIFVFLMVVFVIYSIRAGKKTEEVEDKPRPLWLASLMIVFSGLALAIGSDLLVTGAVTVARLMNVSEKVIGLTVVAIGTSLPELAASLVAAFKKEMDISIGNIIGSNIFNILSVLGFASLIHPIRFEFSDYIGDLLLMLAFAVALIVFVLPWRKNWAMFVRTKHPAAFAHITGGVLGRVSGGVLLIAYIGYCYIVLL